ncbi:MAG TPA: rhodanese-like domain-containing protein [Bacteroidetes bacterium]|nr:rhodanese-like domain-containing protein [Bacteroidota bacterium]
MGLLGNLFGQKVDVAQLVKDGAVIIDVRSKGEFQQGHAKGAVNIPVDRIRDQIEKIRKFDKPVVTCCASGMRSGNAKSILSSAGIEAHNGGPWQNVQRVL